MSDLIRDALERLVNTSEVRDWDTSEARNWQWHVAMCYARQVLADTPRAATFLRQSAPAPAPTPVEASEPAAWLWEYIGPDAYAKRCSPVARALHEMNPSNPPYPESWRPIAPLYDFHQPAPAAVPVAVAERPWEREGWCDAEGRCWWSHGPTPTARWSLLPIDGMDDARGWLLPHWAIPIPQPPQGGEVA
jgi:hypothetical protein